MLSAGRLSAGGRAWGACTLYTSVLSGVPSCITVDASIAVTVCLPLSEQALRPTFLANSNDRR